MKKIILFSLMLILASALQAQTIKMNFPAFAGKTYDFIIFQGNTNIKAQQDTIPADGKFELKIPEEYAPYNGMCRWLITNSREGGGLDMSIPGKGYEVTCLSDKPSPKNIVYEGYDPVNELNKLYEEQQSIVSKFELMNNAMQVYNSEDKLYAIFAKEKEKQVKAYRKFQKTLKTNPNYNARFLPIVNLTQGIPNELTSDYKERALLNAKYIANDLNLDDLYTSGHWSGILASWVQLHTQALSEDSLMLPHFIKMGQRISSPKRYTDFVERITYYLNYYGQDDYISLLAPEVISSGKITEYTGKLSVYQKTLIGMQAPSLFLLTKKANGKTQTTELPSADFAQNNANSTLLIFYESGCAHCEILLGELPSNYDYLKQKGVDIITISADTDENVFRNTASAFPWKRAYCNLEGMSGINFTNYAVYGTPTIFAIDKQGKIITQMASMQQILDFVEK